MGLDVRGHVIDKNFNVVKKDLFDYLPYDFRFTFYFSSVDGYYKNAEGFPGDAVFTRLEKLGLLEIGWTSLVKVNDVQLYLKERCETKADYVSSDLYNLIMSLQPEHVLVVNGDQYYDNIYSEFNKASESYPQDPWFENIEAEAKKANVAADFNTYFQYIAEHGTCICTPFGMRPEVYAMSLDSGVNLRATSCSEGYVKYIEYFVNDNLYLEIVKDYHTGISVKRCTGEFTLEVFKALMNKLTSK